MSIPPPQNEISEEILQKLRSKSVYGLVSFYELVSGWKFPAHLFPVARALCDERIKKLSVAIGPGSGKALKNGTNVFTEDGWRPIETLKMGDRVISPTGEKVTILAVCPQPKMQLYKLVFRDGRHAIANGKHLWKTYNKDFRKTFSSFEWRLRTTEEIMFYLNNANHVPGRNKTNTVRWYVPLSEAISYPEKSLPIHPYLLGVLLGDGHLPKNAGTPVITTMDPEIIERIKELGYAVSKGVSKKSNSGYIHKAKAYGISGIKKELRLLGLNGTHSWDKFIPDIYKKASIEQRLELIRGLLDTDGSMSCGLNYSSTSKKLMEDFREVLWSLGGSGKISEHQTQFTYKGVKKNGRLSYQLGIRHANPESLVFLERKKLYNYQYSPNPKLEIISIEPYEVAESTCLILNSQDGLFLIDDFIVTHNSSLLSIYYPAWILGHDSSQTILGISASEGLIQGFVQASMEIIEWAPWYKVAFPNVKPDKEAGWSPSRGMYITGRSIGIPDPSYVGVGLTSKTLTGKHAKTIIIDDLNDAENTYTAEQRKRVIEKYYSQLVGRADPGGARYIVAGRRWAMEDLIGWLMAKEEEEWVTMTLPAERKSSTRLYWDITVPDGLECCFTQDNPDE